MRRIPCLIVAVCLWALSAFTQAKMTTFNSEDGVFRFDHSDQLVDCKSDSDSCISQGAMCSSQTSGATTIVCYAYPKDKFKDKPTFVAAVFFVAEVLEAGGQKACLQGSQDWNTDDVESTTINGARFKAFHLISVGLGSSEEDRFYRTFHNNRCYELGVQTAGNAGSYEPGTIKQFSKRDQHVVEADLRQALHSFRFLK